MFEPVLAHELHEGLDPSEVKIAGRLREFVKFAKKNLSDGYSLPFLILKALDRLCVREVCIVGLHDVGLHKLVGYGAWEVLVWVRPFL